MNMADNLSTAIMQTLTDSCPDMDWASGSVARELIAVPAALLGTVFDKYVKDAYKLFDIDALRSDPENNKEAIDKWFSMLNIEDNNEQTAYGKIKIYLSAMTNTLVIMKGTAFTVANVRVLASETTTWAGMDITDATDVSYATNYPDGSYSIELDVAVTSTTSISLAVGTAVSWTSAPSNVTGVYVSSAIAGGTTKLTYAEKAEKIYDMLQKPSLTTESNIQALLRNTFPTVINSVKVGRRESTSVNTVNLYVKPVRAPEVFTITADINNGECAFSGCGIYAITSVSVNNKDISDYSVHFEGTIGASDSIIKISLPTITNGKITVCCEGFRAFNDIAAMLNDVHTLSACRFRLLLPTIVYINVAIKTDNTLTDTAKQAVYDYINTCTMNTTVLSDTSLSVILTKQGIVTKGPTLYTADIVHGTTKYVQTAVGAINLSQLSFDSDIPTACYSFFNSVSVL